MRFVTKVLMLFAFVGLSSRSALAQRFSVEEMMRFNADITEAMKTVDAKAAVDYVNGQTGLNFMVANSVVMNVYPRFFAEFARPQLEVVRTQWGMNHSKIELKSFAQVMSRLKLNKINKSYNLENIMKELVESKDDNYIPGYEMEIIIDRDSLELIKILNIEEGATF